MKTAILVGCGGWGQTWVEHTLPRGVHDGLITVIGAVDTNADHLVFVKKNLNLTDGQCFTNLEKALSELNPDICVIAAPPAAHEAIAITAMEYGCDVLSEKPITDNPDSMFRLLRKAEDTGKKYGITMSHRFNRHIATLRNEILSGKYGYLDYIVFNFSARQEEMNGRQKKLENVMLNEASIHHFNLLESLVGSECETMFVDKWCPMHALDMKGGAQSLTVMKFKNNVRVGYEMSMCNASSLNSWGNESIRAELEKATLVLNGNSLHCYLKEEPEEMVNFPGTGFEIPLIGNEEERWGNDLLLEQFVLWVNGGKAMPTELKRSFRSQMMVFAAIESGEQKKIVNIDELIHDYQMKFKRSEELL